MVSESFNESDVTPIPMLYFPFIGWTQLYVSALPQHSALRASCNACDSNGPVALNSLVSRAMKLEPEHNFIKPVQQKTLQSKFLC